MSDFAGQNQQPDGEGKQADFKADETPAVLGGDDYLNGADEQVNDEDKRFQEADKLVETPVPHAPEAYEIDYGQPGIDPYIDQQFRNFAHENGISGQLAQKLVDFNNSLEEGRMQEHQIQTDAWEKQTRSLPGWQGKNYRQNMGVANKALQTFASPELAEMIRASGFSCHPEIVKAFYNVGMRLSEDSYVDSKKNTSREKTIGEVLYPNQPI
ncbi:endoprotease [Maridesulfovibrio zosterae]|uniref:endoprotease n=1 Tax=Maridesulfovibrio zosterae TaxID=82171 RepID=UPI00040E8BF1|nr:endoprotease [Maridesulfovibrio zosterae]